MSILVSNSNGIKMILYYKFCNAQSRFLNNSPTVLNGFCLFWNTSLLGFRSKNQLWNQAWQRYEFRMHLESILGPKIIKIRIQNRIRRGAGGVLVFGTILEGGRSCPGQKCHTPWGGWEGGYEGTILGGRTNHTRLVHPLKGVGGYTPPMRQNPPSKSGAIRKGILTFLKKVSISLQRGDIDVSPFHTELQFFSDFRMYLAFCRLFDICCRYIKRFAYF